MPQRERASACKRGRARTQEPRGTGLATRAPLFNGREIYLQHHLLLTA